MKITELTKDQLVKLVSELVSALDYCGWGDTWEREVSAELRKRVEELEVEPA